MSEEALKKTSPEGKQEQHIIPWFNLLETHKGNIIKYSMFSIHFRIAKLAEIHAHNRIKAEKADADAESNPRQGKTWKWKRERKKNNPLLNTNGILNWDK